MNWQPIIFLVEQLSTDDQAQVDLWLYRVGIAVVALIGLLLAGTLSLRFIALRTTRPCRWCMEFIPKSATTCPRCGKSLGARTSGPQG